MAGQSADDRAVSGCDRTIPSGTTPRARLATANLGRMSRRDQILATRPSCSPRAASTGSRSPSSARPAASPARRSTSTSRPRTRCSPRCWSRSARSCSRSGASRVAEPPTTRGSARGARRVARRLRAAAPAADRRPGPRLGVAARRGPRAGARPAAGVRRRVGRRSCGCSTRGSTADASRAMAHAAFGLINSTPHSGLLPDAQMRDAAHARWPSARSASAEPTVARRRSDVERLVAAREAAACDRGVLGDHAGRRTTSGLDRRGPRPPTSPSAPRRARRPARDPAQVAQQLVARQPAQLESARTGRPRSARPAGRAPPARAGTGRAQASQVQAEPSSPPYGSSSTPASSACLDQRVRQLAGQQRGDPAGLGARRAR